MRRPVEKAGRGLLAGFVLLLLAAMPANARADAEGAMLKAVAGGVELSRGGTGEWEQVGATEEVAGPDEIRTVRGGRAVVALIDGSTIEIGPDAQLGIERLEYDAAGKRNIAVFRLKHGIARVRAGERYSAARSRFEVETPSAVVSSQAAEFLILYDEPEQYTEVVGLRRQVEVVASIGVIGPRATVGANEAVRIERGKFPSAVKRLEDETVKAYLAQLQTGSTVAEAAAPADRLVAVHPVFSGRVLRPEDLPDAVAAQVSERAVGRIAVGKPEDPLGERLLPDVRVHEQPIPEFLAAPPGEVPTGGVEVDF